MALVRSDHCLDSALLQADSERTNTFELSVSSTKTTRLQLDVDPTIQYSVICGRGKATKTTQETRDLAGKFVENYLTLIKAIQIDHCYIVARTREMVDSFASTNMAHGLKLDHFRRQKSECNVPAICIPFTIIFIRCQDSSVAGFKAKEDNKNLSSQSEAHRQNRTLMILYNVHVECSDSSTDSLGFDYRWISTILTLMSFRLMECMYVRN
jgi:hypothetical protein